MNRYAFLFCVTALATPIFAQELELPAQAKRMASETAKDTSLPLPIGPFAFGEVPKIWADGNISRRSWRVAGRNHSTSQTLSGLKNQLATQGWDILFECKDSDCGGFDFRFNINVISEPDMHVNLGDYLYLSAQKEGETYPSYVSILVSKNAEAGFLQITNITPTEETPSVLTPDPVSPKTETPVSTVSDDGVLVLEDLLFQPGSADLTAGDYASLENLAALLKENPKKKAILVGHTDAVGALEVNIAISEKRAISVMTRMVEQYEISADRLSAKGVGFLAPRASNDTDEGRQKNRRVVAIMTTTR